MQRMNLLILKHEGSFPSAEGGYKNGPECLSERESCRRPVGGGGGGPDTGREKEGSMEESARWGTSVQRRKCLFPTLCSYTEMTSSFPSVTIAQPVFLTENSQALAEWPKEGFVVPSPITGLWLRHFDEC